MNPIKTDNRRISDEGRYIGLDIGGSKITAAVAGKDLRILRRLREQTPVGLSEGLALIKQMVHELTPSGLCRAIGAAIGGPLDWEKGIVSPLHQPQWRNVPLKELMEEEFQCPFFVDVDTNVAVLGEYYVGQETASRLLYLTISTGMGGGFLIDGQLYRGAGGAHPEVGHQSVHFQCAYPERVVCECGARDCLEALVSGTGIQRIYGKKAEFLSDSEWQEVGYNLGQGLRNLAAVYTPDVIVLGGGVALGAGERLLTPARKVLEHSLNIVPIPEIRLDRLGADTPLLGALAMAMGSESSK